MILLLFFEHINTNLSPEDTHDALNHRTKFI